MITINKRDIPAHLLKFFKPAYVIKPKDEMQMPSRLAIALQQDGWWLRSDIVWAKSNPMPESCRDRPTSAHEHIFLLTKSGRYFYDADAVREVGFLPAGTHRRMGSTAQSGTNRRDEDRHIEVSGTRNMRNVWRIATEPCPEAHFATMPKAVAERCIKAGCPAGGTVLDPFGGSGTTAIVADRLGRNAILIELSGEYAAMSLHRIENDAPMFAVAEISKEKPVQTDFLAEVSA